MSATTEAHAQELARLREEHTEAITKQETEARRAALMSAAQAHQTAAELESAMEARSDEHEENLQQALQRHRQVQETLRDKEEEHKRRLEQTMASLEKYKVSSQKEREAALTEARLAVTTREDASRTPAS